MVEVADKLTTDAPNQLFESLVTISSNDSVEKKLAESVTLIDVGNLLAFNPRPVDTKDFKSEPNEYIKEMSTLSVQLLLDKLFYLPIERVDDTIVAKLPKGTTPIPREKPLPKPKPMTKWEKYAKLKGIQKTKKPRKVFDPVKNEWRPTYGYKRANDSTKDWLIEIKKNQDPNQDFFSKRTEARNERTAKNELQRLRNIARSTKKKVPGVGITPIDADKPDKLQLKKQLSIAKRSDASMSKFSQKLKDEDKTTKGFGKKRKFESNYSDVKSEKEKQIKIFEKLTSNRDKSSKEKLNIDKAANKHIQQESSERESGGKKKGKGGKGGGKRRSSAGSHSKPKKGGKGGPRKGRK